MMSATTRCLCPSLVLLLIGTAASLAAEDGVRFQMKTVSDARTATDTVTVAGERMLIDMQDIEGGQDADLVFAGDRDEMLIINHDDETVMVLDKETIAGIADQLSGAMKEIEKALESVPADQRPMIERMMKQRMGSLGAAEEAPERTMRTKGSAEYAGRKCQLHEMWTGQEHSADICTVAFDSVDGGAMLVAAFEKMTEFYEELFEALSKSPMLQGMQGMVERGNPFGFDDLPGFPVMSRRYDGDEVVSESILESIERTTVDMADLDAPANYKRQGLGVSP